MVLVCGAITLSTGGSALAGGGLNLTGAWRGVYHCKTGSCAGQNITSAVDHWTQAAGSSTVVASSGWTGTLSGHTLKLHGQSGSYSWSATLVFSADGNSFSGPLSDSNHTSGLDTGQRLSGSSTPTPTTSPATTTTGPTTAPTPAQVVCVSIWTADCAGILPKPPPIQTCVSLWQVCDGFGGSNPASPPVLNLTSDSSALSTPVGCQESAANPYASQSPVPPVAGGVAGAGDACTLSGLVETDDLAALDKPDGRTWDQEKWDNSWAVFEPTARGKITGIRYAVRVCKLALLNCTGNPEQLKIATRLQDEIGVLVDEYTSQWLIPGEPIDLTRPNINLQNLCEQLRETTPVLPGSAAVQCYAMTMGLQQEVDDTEQALATFKHDLGVDVPRPADRTTQANGSTRAHHAVPILSGTVKLRQGHRGTLRLAPTKAGRAVIRDLKKAGVTRMSALAIVTASTIPGLQSTRKVRVVLRLH